MKASHSQADGCVVDGVPAVQPDAVAADQCVDDGAQPGDPFGSGQWLRHGQHGPEHEYRAVVILGVALDVPAGSVGVCRRSPAAIRSLLTVCAIIAAPARCICRSYRRYPR